MVTESIEVVQLKDAMEVKTRTESEADTRWIYYAVKIKSNVQGMELLTIWRKLVLEDYEACN